MPPLAAASRLPRSAPPLSPPPLADSFREQVYRIVFVLAGVYNLAFGAWAGFWPGAFFRWFAMEAPRYPALWACLGMVVGVYGLLYLYGARHLDRAWPIIAVGLLGKVLGPAGLMVTAAQGELPLRMLSLLVFNDLVWWLPFGLFLLEGTRAGERVRGAAPWVAAALHALAIVVVAGLSGGTELQADLSERARHVVSNPVLWPTGWAVWMAAALSLTGFYAWWGGRIANRRLALFAVFAAAAGMACDLFGESLYLAWLPERAAELLAGQPGAAARMLALQSLATTMTALVANALYTAGGIALTVGTPSLSKLSRWMAWTAWVAGAGMSAAALAGSARGIVAASAVLFPLLVLLCVRVGRELR